VPTATVPAFGPLVSPWIYRVRLGDPEEKADAPYADILLSAHCERPRRRAA